MDAKPVSYKVGDVWKSRGSGFRVKVIRVNGKEVLLELMDGVNGYSKGYQFHDYGMDNYKLLKKERVIPWL
jgi:hypothetical protein